MQREPIHANPRTSEGQPAPGSRAQSNFPREEAFWRSWLATGARRVPIDRRRARGADSHLKQILVGAPSGAVDFSSAMARQAVDEALHELPAQHKQVVKLAYFGGLTNREIAEELGLTISDVRRVLRASLATVGEHFKRRRAKGRRAIHDLAMLPWWRNSVDGVQRAPWPALDHVLQTGIVVVMTAAAAVLLVTHQAPVHAGHHRPAHVATAGAVGSNLQPDTANLEAVLNQPARLGPVPNAVGHPESAAAVAARMASLTSLPGRAMVPSIMPKLRAPGLIQLPFRE